MRESLPLRRGEPNGSRGRVQRGVPGGAPAAPSGAPPPQRPPPALAPPPPTRPGRSPLAARPSGVVALSAARSPGAPGPPRSAPRGHSARGAGRARRLLGAVGPGPGKAGLGAGGVGEAKRSSQEGGWLRVRRKGLRARPEQVGPWRAALQTFGRVLFAGGGEERGFDCPGSCWDQHDVLRAVRAEPDKPCVRELGQNLAQSCSRRAVTPGTVGTGARTPPGLTVRSCVGQKGNGVYYSSVCLHQRELASWKLSKCFNILERT